jgi:hypothetical protein
VLHIPGQSDLRLHRNRLSDFLDTGGRITMIYQRVLGRESFCGYKLLSVEAAIRLSELNMSLFRDVSQGMVMGHTYLE